MNIVYLSPHYPAHYSLFVEQLAGHNVNVFGITDVPDERLPVPLQQALTAHYKVPCLEDTSRVLEACHFFQRHFGPIHRVESHLEPWLELEGIVRAEFNVPGPKPDDLKFLKQKSLMKKIFTDAGVPTARGILVYDFDQCMHFIDGRFPVFIKPDIGVGADDTYTIRSENDLRNFFAGRKSYDYFMEEFLSGVIESFDGLADGDGNVAFFASHVFSNDIHNVVKQNENLWYYSQREIPEDIQKYGRSIVKAAGLREKFFHIEFFRAPNGELKGLELNMRPPGGLTTHMFNYACDVDVYAWWASIIAGNSGVRPYNRLFHCAYVGRKYDRSYEYSHDQLFGKWDRQIVHCQPMNPIEFSVMGHWGYLVRSPILEECKQLIGDIVAEA